MFLHLTMCKEMIDLSTKCLEIIYLIYMCKNGFGIK